VVDVELRLDGAAIEVPALAFCEIYSVASDKARRDEAQSKGVSTTV
jgi:hypothetical protein